ncbi:unnamed protein product [Protopolystoma xenopodis]|uniref:Uncharacterized protein n=1 Tax=Protopolystoma xenopodis TaxID=117903 RepID=A0A448WNB3_9PLAT|nr:unnamed protein product [Protopolystoma xenopodis]
MVGLESDYLASPNHEIVHRLERMLANLPNSIWLKQTGSNSFSAGVHGTSSTNPKVCHSGSLVGGTFVPAFQTGLPSTRPVGEQHHLTPVYHHHHSISPPHQHHYRQQPQLHQHRAYPVSTLMPSAAVATGGVGATTFGRMASVSSPNGAGDPGNLAQQTHTPGYQGGRRRMNDMCVLCDS